ncbi:hypothetical protein PR048_033472 [Dryococelus australis]|uniref:Uncharacterized protein n=1 Tax=Dryococelus australis TaxID=614101 RepID=A0ABQ9G4I6_9NEOP|nr:hypothetical protein PR048_033472 [Dryococelus australis]
MPDRVAAVIAARANREPPKTPDGYTKGLKVLPPPTLLRRPHIPPRQFHEAPLESARLDSTVLCVVGPQMLVHWLLPQRVASVTPHLPIWHSLLVSLRVFYWHRVVQGVSNELLSNYKCDSSVQCPWTASLRGRCHVVMETVRGRGGRPWGGVVDGEVSQAAARRAARTCRTALMPAGRGTIWSSTGMQGWRKLEIPEKTRRPAASSGTIPTCENPGGRRGGGATHSGIELGSPWEVSSLTTTPPRPTALEKSEAVVYTQHSVYLFKSFPQSSVVTLAEITKAWRSDEGDLGSELGPNCLMNFANRALDIFDPITELQEKSTKYRATSSEPRLGHQPMSNQLRLQYAKDFGV